MKFTNHATASNKEATNATLAVVSVTHSRKVFSDKGNLEAVKSVFTLNNGQRKTIIGANAEENKLALNIAKQHYGINTK